jgi:hypothetical protein
MKIHWLAAHESRSRDDLIHANLASIRLRAGALLSAAGRDVDFSMGDTIPASCKADLLVVGKITIRDKPDRAAHWLAACEKFKDAGGKIVLDYTENLVSADNERGRFYREALPMADLVVCSSRWLRDSLQPHFAGETAVIEDAIEVRPIPPRKLDRKPATALWFGHATNLHYLIRLLAAWPEKRIRTRILVQTNHEGIHWLRELNMRLPPNLALGASLWSVNNMLGAAGESDFCMIPSDPADPAKAGVSSNRLITALALGLPTAAERVDSYREFSDYFVDIRSREFVKLLGDPCAYSEMVRKAQIDVVPRFDREIVGRKWLAALEQV